MSNFDSVSLTKLEGALKKHNTRKELQGIMSPIVSIDADCKTTLNDSEFDVYTNWIYGHRPLVCLK